MTSYGVKPNSFKAFIYDSEVGLPSNIHPFIIQSGFDNLSLTNYITNSSGSI